MIPESYEKLIALRELKTPTERVNWKSTGDPSAFVVYFDDFSLVLRHDESTYEDPEQVWVLLVDSNGNTIDSFSVAGDADYARLHQLHGNARRKALRIDEALSKLVERLESDAKVGDEPPPKGRPGTRRALTQPDDDLPF
jgi:hypothetical protein